MKTKIKLPTMKCTRCGHRWFPKKQERPLRCASCKSPYWDRVKGSITKTMSEIVIGDKKILISYKTPVAYYQKGVGFAKTDKFWSRTTSRHINSWIEMSGYVANRGDGLREISQDKLDALIKEK